MNYIELVWAFFATFFFCIIFNLKGIKLIYGGIAGILGWYIYMYFSQNHSVVYAFFMSSVGITIYAEIVSKKLKTASTVLLIPALIPLVPGSGIFFTMSNLVQQNYTEAFKIGMQTLFITVAITLGIVVVTSFAQIFYRTIYFLFSIKFDSLFYKRFKK